MIMYSLCSYYILDGSIKKSSVDLPGRCIQSKNEGDVNIQGSS